MDDNFYYYRWKSKLKYVSDCVQYALNGSDVFTHKKVKDIIPAGNVASLNLAISEINEVLREMEALKAEKYAYDISLSKTKEVK